MAILNKDRRGWSTAAAVVINGRVLLGWRNKDGFGPRHARQSVHLAVKPFKIIVLHCFFDPPKFLKTEEM
jgi:hypothetical protein